MSSLFFNIRTFNPNDKTTFFMHKNYTNYIANSQYVIRNEKTSHGLFGKVEAFPNINNMENLEPIIKHITNLADKKFNIYRGIASLREYDAIRLGYDTQEKWKELLESKLQSLSKQLSIRYENLQYVGAVHIEKGHPHFQFFVWDKQQEKRKYFVHHSKLNKLRIEFTNTVFKDDLLPIYIKKDEAKKGIISENYILEQLRELGYDKQFIRQVASYENNFYGHKIMKRVFKDEELENIIESLVELRKELNEAGSIKYQYLEKDVKQKVDNIAKQIIELSPECKKQIEIYIKAKQQLEEFKYTNKEKLENAKKLVRKDAEAEIVKLIGNEILDFERQILKTEKIEQVEYINKTRDLIGNIYSILCSISYSKEAEVNLKNIRRELSKQAKKEKCLEKKIRSNWEWRE